MWAKNMSTLMVGDLECMIISLIPWNIEQSCCFSSPYRATPVEYTLNISLLKAWPILDFFFPAHSISLSLLHASIYPVQLATVSGHESVILFYPASIHEAYLVDTIWIALLLVYLLRSLSMIWESTITFFFFCWNWGTQFVTISD